MYFSFCLTSPQNVFCGKMHKTICFEENQAENRGIFVFLSYSCFKFFVLPKFRVKFKKTFWEVLHFFYALSSGATGNPVT